MSPALMTLEDLRQKRQLAAPTITKIPTIYKTGSGATEVVWAKFSLAIMNGN
jgi:hypothetical protein